MKTVGAFEAKTHFSQLLRQVEQGESFEIRRRNRPVARLVGVADQDRDNSVRDMVRRVAASRKTVSLAPEEIHGWIKEGRP